MGLRVLLAHLTGGSGDEPVIQAALELATRFTARVTALNVQPSPGSLVPLALEGAPGALIEQIMAHAAAESARATARIRDVVETACRMTGVAVTPASAHGPRPSATIVDAVGDEDALVIRHGRVADLIVTARPVAPRPDALELTLALEAALFGSARPVLVIPPDNGGRPAMLGSAAVVAWNGSAQAAHAVTAALSLLRAAPRVAVIAADEGRGNGTLPELIDYLAWHDVTAEPVALRAAAADVGARLLAEAAARSAGLLVMGAYTHSRLREWVLGGATRHVLAAATIPLLMAH
jgi:nucleotide-binding universal stress UspA family protein